MHEWTKRRLANRIRSELDIHRYDRYEEFGFHVLPFHFYSPIPNIEELLASPGRWHRKRSMTGIDLDLESQLMLLRDLTAYAEDVRALPLHDAILARKYGLGCHEIKAQILFSLLRYVKPRRVIEVGSGVSTFYVLEALHRNTVDKKPTENLTCIEPVPARALTDLVQSSPVACDLIVEPVESLDPARFDVLQTGDVLIVDSAHAIRLAGDVEYLYLEVLPRLQTGVWICIDDITLPYPTVPPDHHLFNMFALWRETDLLQALLIGNDRLRIRLSGGILHHETPDRLTAAFPSYTFDRYKDRPPYMVCLDVTAPTRPLCGSD